MSLCAAAGRKRSSGRSFWINRIAESLSEAYPAVLGINYQIILIVVFTGFRRIMLQLSFFFFAFLLVIIKKLFYDNIQVVKSGTKWFKVVKS